MPTNTPTPYAEKRRAPRARRLREARCVFNHGSSLLDVTVRNISPFGARITSGGVIRLPPTFELRILDGVGGHSARRARLVWCKGAIAGIEFID